MSNLENNLQLETEESHLALNVAVLFLIDVDINLQHVLLYNLIFN